MWSLQLAVFLLTIAVLHASYDDWGDHFSLQFPAVQQGSWISVPRTRIANFNLDVVGTRSFSLPSFIPSSAVEVLILARVQAHTPGYSTSDYIKIYTQANVQRYEKYLYIRSLSGQKAFTVNSDNMWFPATDNRLVFVETTQYLSWTNLNLDVIGYR